MIATPHPLSLVTAPHANVILLNARAQTREDRKGALAWSYKAVYSIGQMLGCLDFLTPTLSYCRTATLRCCSDLHCHLCYNTVVDMSATDFQMHL